MSSRRPRRRKVNRAKFVATHVRCSKCSARRTLSRHPDMYSSPGRVPRCKGGGCHSRKYRVDKYRERCEVGPGAPRPCLCGEYIGRTGNMPHARGRGWCEHNPRVTDEDRQRRWEDMESRPRRNWML